ncbi:MAG: hydroxyacid dehydrogenase [Chloroflexi bacterium]|nr:hydroxyacid dehydrogenase [Chloroflexota bacterium]
MKKVLLDKPIHPQAMALLRQEVEPLEMYQASLDELRALLPHVHGVIVSVGFPIRAHEIKLGQRLEVIGRPGAGTDSVDVEAATCAGIPVVYTPDAPTESVAEHTLCMMLMLAKRMRVVENALRAGHFEIRTQVVGSELRGKTVGVVGFGHIGRRVAEICQRALDSPILVYDPYVDPEQVCQQGMEPVAGILELMSRSDVVTIHTPLNEDTCGLVGRPQLAAMKPSGFLINTSRGPVVDEAALIEALRHGQIAGAGLDVFEKEPPHPDNPLFQMENVVVTPHVSSFTAEGRARMGITVVQEVLKVFRGECPTFLINPEVWPQRRILP